MHSHRRALALSAVLLMPVVTYAAVARHPQGAAQPGAYTFQGTVRSFAAKTGSLELITAVGMALRIVQVSVAPAAHAGGGTAARLAGLEFKPGDVVRVECHRTDTGLVADRIEKVAVPKP
ncbi:MAG TPA: hypothetical protein VIV88_08980 [Gemmatimonadales bacterium]